MKTYFEHNEGETSFEVVEYVEPDTDIIPISPERMAELRKLAERWHEEHR